MDSVRRHMVVHGRVQGVYFRESARRMAAAAGLAGWVRNLADGGVEAVFEGAPGAVAAAAEWMREGPDRALVTEFEELPAQKPEGLVGFEVRH